MNVLCRECEQPLIIHSFQVPQGGSLLIVYAFSAEDDAFCRTEAEGSIYSREAERERLAKRAKRFGMEWRRQQEARVLELLCTESGS